MPGLQQIVRFRRPLLQIATDILDSMTTAPPATGRILVVDDEESILDFVELGLRYEGFEVERATDGTDALRLVEQRRMDLIVLDLNLPSVDGIDVCRAIRKRGDTPIIM